MKKESWVISAIATCECGWRSESMENANAVGANHAKRHGHYVTVEVVTVYKYDGRTAVSKGRRTDE